MTAPAQTFTSGLAATLARKPATSSLRDFFAAQALAGLLANGEIYENHLALATEAYRIADAMLVTRVRRPL
jgi:hypothetical protein